MFVLQFKCFRIATYCAAFVLPSLVAIARSVEVRFLGVETSASGLYIKNGADFEAISIPLYRASHYYEVDANDGGEVALYTKVDSSTGDARYELATGGRVSQKSAAFLCVYMITADGKPRL